MNFAQAAAELHQQELARLSDGIPPTLARMRSMTPGPFRATVALMLGRLGYEIINEETARDLIVVKDGKKMIVICADPANPADTQSPALGRLHDAIRRHNAESGYFVTSRDFTPDAEDYAKTAPIKLVDGQDLDRSMRKSFEGVELPETYHALCCQCGCTVQHRLDGADALPCPEGHMVPPTIAIAALRPTARPVPAKQRPNPQARLLNALMSALSGKKKMGRRFRPGR